MNLIPKVVSRGLGGKFLSVKKQSPHIFFAAGMVGFVGTVVLASKAARQLDRVLDEINEDVDNVKVLSHSKMANDLGEYVETDYRKDLAYVYGKGGLKIAKLYGPTVVVGAVSVSLLTGSHVSLTRRNAALMAAYTSVSEAFYAYRSRVQKEIGVEKELDIYHAAEDVEVINEIGELEKVKAADPNKWSAYARFFDEASPYWEKNSEVNFIFVKAQQAYANNLLQARGHVFLNEVYDMLGIDRTQAGSVVGWVMGNGDNHVDFGLYEATSTDFVRGWERNVLLDFNVDGVIYNLI